MSIPLDTHSTLSLVHKIMSEELCEAHHWSDLDQAFNALYETCNSILELKELNEHLVLLMGEQGILPSEQRYKSYRQGGDVALIDQIYLYQTQDKFGPGTWDQFCQSSAAAKAIRNRKAYFKRCLRHLEVAHSDASVLHLPGGSGREIFEYLEENEDSTCRLDFVSADRESISFARELNRNHLDQIAFHTAHAFRFRPKHTYALIWGGAICDYLDDEYVVHLLSRMREWVDPEGNIVLSSFSNQNPSRAYMELMMDWYLYHRAPADWIQLARWSGFHQDAISIQQDDIGVYLSLTVR